MSRQAYMNVGRRRQFSDDVSVLFLRSQTKERAMAAGGRREEIDARIALWERDLERLRVALANAPEALNAKHHPTFVELYRRKEVAKSRWEAIRGVYRPEAQGVRRCEDALAAVEAAWPQAHAMLTEVLPVRAA